MADLESAAPFDQSPERVLSEGEPEPGSGRAGRRRGADPGRGAAATTTCSPRRPRGEVALGLVRRRRSGRGRDGGRVREGRGARARGVLGNLAGRRCTWCRSRPVPAIDRRVAATGMVGRWISASIPSPECARACARSTTSPTRASPASSTWPTGSRSRSWSRVRPVRARPSWPSRWPRSPAADSSASSATRASTSPRRCTSGTTRSSCSASRPNATRTARWQDLEDDIFSDEFLLTRPLLEAIRAEDPVVLLIDEVDRVEVETEALLLEILSDYQVSIPELGTVEAKQIPLVFLTSNNTRELSEALKRRCLFLHIDYPDLEREKRDRAHQGARHHREPGRPGRPHRAVDPSARAEEEPVGVRDARLGPHAAAAGRRDRSASRKPPTRSTSCSSTRPTSRRRSKEFDRSRRRRSTEADRSDGSSTTAQTDAPHARAAGRVHPGAARGRVCRSASPRTSTPWRRCSTSRSRIVRRSSTRSAPRW